MRSRFPSTQGLLVQIAIAESVRRRVGFVFILGRLLESGKLDVDPRRTLDSKASLLHEPSFLGCGSKIPKDRKVGFALIVASTKLRPYFQAHTILVMTDQPLRKVMGRPDAVGRMV